MGGNCKNSLKNIMLGLPNGNMFDGLKQGDRT